jgi:hypothetical protein
MNASIYLTSTRPPPPKAYRKREMPNKNLFTTLGFDGLEEPKMRPRETRRASPLEKPQPKPERGLTDNVLNSFGHSGGLGSRGMFQMAGNN